MVYRIIYVRPEDGLADSGATYPQCSRENQPACDPQERLTVNELIDYAYEHGETPVQVYSVEEAWDIVEGRKQVTADMILQQGISFNFLSNPVVLAIGAYLAWKVIR